MSRDIQRADVHDRPNMEMKMPLPYLHLTLTRTCTRTHAHAHVHPPWHKRENKSRALFSSERLYNTRILEIKREKEGECMCAHVID